MRLVSDSPNPILSGSSPTLTCAVELSPAVDVPVTVNTEWTGPDGSILTSAASPIMNSFTHYTSDAKLNYIESADSGDYNCTVSIGGKIRTSIKKKITIGKCLILLIAKQNHEQEILFCLGDDMFQLRLMYTDDCRMWNNYVSSLIMSVCITIVLPCRETGIYICTTLKRLLLKPLRVAASVIFPEPTCSRHRSAVLAPPTSQPTETLSLEHTTSTPPSSLDSFRTG